MLCALLTDACGGEFLQGQLQGEGGLPEAMATIFVWLRYSSSRQLTWQRNYNTQPRILGEAQARLTQAIAQVLSFALPFLRLSPCSHAPRMPAGVCLLKAPLRRTCASAATCPAKAVFLHRWLHRLLLTRAHCCRRMQTQRVWLRSGSASC